MAGSRPIRRAQISFGAIWASESAFMVALGVVAFRAGGVGALGIVTAARMAAAAFLRRGSRRWPTGSAASGS
jgi:hypothetical protein